MIRPLAIASLLSIALTAAGRTEEPAKYAGSWTKEADGLTLNLNFKKAGELDFKVEAGENSILMACTYDVAKDGTLKLKMVKKTIKGEFPFVPKDDFTFQFKLKVEKDQATLSDFDASENADTAKTLVEGKYTKKEEK